MLNLIRITFFSLAYSSGHYHASQMLLKPVFYSSPEDTAYSASENVDTTSSTSPINIVESVDSPLAPLDNSTLLHNISDLAWLNISNETQPLITLSKTNTTYQVLLNTVSFRD